MKRNMGVMIGIVCILISGKAWGSWEDTLKTYSCIEIEKFQVDREDYSTKDRERAAAIPDETLSSLQHKIVGELSRQSVLPKITKANENPCTGKSLAFGGKIVDYKKGNRAARILIGFGAGKQKFEVESYLKDKQSGESLATKKIIDRKVGGLAGGDEAKGEYDFAEKVAQFVKMGK